MISPDTINVLSVTEFTQFLKSSLELQFRFVHIQGEVSNLRIPYSGHMYFTLKDSTAQIKAVLFKGQQRYLPSKIKEGQSIICHGKISVYEPRGEYQIIVDTIDFTGTGDLRVQFEKLKRSLSDEGFFRIENKVEIPAFPEHIVLITSPTGAAVRDFLKIALKRKFWGNISILPVAVQGRNASFEIAQAINTACLEIEADIVVLLRGGGSLEDLWAFNEERTARAIHESRIPIVTGIGHDTDITIADMCADLHTHTPTAAAEAIIPDRTALQHVFKNYRRGLADIMQQRLGAGSEKIRSLRRIIGNLDLFLANYSLKLDYRTTSLTNIVQRKLSSLNARYENAIDRLHNQAPLHRLSLQEQKLGHLRHRLAANLQRAIERKENNFSRLVALLDSVSPLSVLARGYSIVSKREEKLSGGTIIITRSDQVEKGTIVHVQLHQGGLECEVLVKKNGAQLPR
jgi:exodeoxyribonuclease VII large subunit